ETWRPPGNRADRLRPYGRPVPPFAPSGIGRCRKVPVPPGRLPARARPSLNVSAHTNDAARSSRVQAFNVRICCYEKRIHGVAAIDPEESNGSHSAVGNLCRDVPGVLGGSPAGTTGVECLDYPN